MCKVLGSILSTAKKLNLIKKTKINKKEKDEKASFRIRLALSLDIS
jgi:hypothetical protein